MMRDKVSEARGGLQGHRAGMRKGRGWCMPRLGQYLAVLPRWTPPALSSLAHFTKVPQLSSNCSQTLGRGYEASVSKLASAVGRSRSACCTDTGYNEYSDEARYGVMRSAKRTQTYWRAGCSGSGVWGGGREGAPLARRGTPPTTPVTPPLHSSTMLTYTSNYSPFALFELCTGTKQLNTSTS